MQNDPQAAFIESAARLKNRIASQGGPASREREPVPVPRTERGRRSLNTCHRYAQTGRPRKPAPRDSRAYVPELAARIEDDPNLCDGARRCARKLAELTYRRNREDRALPVTVTYLARALGRCRRTVQRYLRQLEREGYVAVDVVVSQRARMCVGLVVRLLGNLMAAHHRHRWPGSLGNPGATPESLNQSKGYYSKAKDAHAQVEGQRMGVQQWAMRCMDGIFRRYMETNPLAGLPPVLPA
ncbi:helix-turn-helix domain-containing protein [Shinella pollutisoli]|uniref:Helix-turn-helix domain-containing protein n=1 Tax=Shinella pollutisoli TaxID=2250594 RepID=A0ABV7DBF5_9HYPH|nr:helix-turn-helix domain-containing protein [Shinella pollutisoli]